MSLEADPQRRAEIIADGHALLDWLEANPGVPIWHWGMEMQFGPDDGREGVARIAEQISERPELVRTTGFYRVTKRFGRAAYVASARPRAQERLTARERRPAA